MPRLEGFTPETEPVKIEKPTPPQEAAQATPPTAPPPPAKPPEPPVKEPQAKETEDKPKSRTPEELAKESTNLLLSRMLGREIPEEKPEGEGEKPPEEPEKKAPAKEKSKPGKQKKPAKEEVDLYAEPKAEGDEEDEPEERPIKRRKTGLSEEKIVRVATEAAAKAVQSAAPQAPQSQQAVIPPALRDEFDRIQVAAVLHPDLYGGRDLAKELVDADKAFQKYERDWKTANPGEAFDWDHDEHRDWADNNTIDIDASHLEEAKRKIEEIRSEAKMEEQFNRKYGQDIAEIKLRRAAEEHAPKLAEAKMQAVDGILRELRPDIADNDETVSGFVRNPRALAEELAKDPVLYQAADRVMAYAINLLDVAGSLHFGIVRPEEMESATQYIRREVGQIEREIASRPDEDRPVLPDGRRFMKLDSYHQRKNRDGYYTVFDWEPLNHIVRLRARNLVKAEVKYGEDFLTRAAQARGYTKGNSGDRSGESGRNGTPEPRRQSAPAPSVTAAGATASKPENRGTLSSSGIPSALVDVYLNKFK